MWRIKGITIYNKKTSGGGLQLLLAGKTCRGTLRNNNNRNNKLSISFLKGEPLSWKFLCAPNKSVRKWADIRDISPRRVELKGPPTSSVSDVHEARKASNEVIIDRASEWAISFAGGKSRNSHPLTFFSASPRDGKDKFWWQIFSKMHAEQRKKLHLSGRREE